MGDHHTGQEALQGVLLKQQHNRDSLLNSMNIVDFLNTRVVTLIR